MSVLVAILEFVILVLCLPFYILAWPLMRAESVKIASSINGNTCPHCDAIIEGRCHKAIQPCGVKLTLRSGPQIDRDRLPKWSIVCPACGERVCFDRMFVVTSCDIGEHIARAVVDPNSGR